VERHRALLEALGDPERIVHTGGHGTGYTVKLKAWPPWAALVVRR
jgi:3-hydroxyisobutyrate dehydrogenase